MYIPNINGIRAIAVILVILAHLAYTPNLPNWLHKILSFCELGSIGVRMFFILSGFLITYLILIEKKKFGFINIKDFFIRRILRIFPCFYMYLFTLFILKKMCIISFIDNETILFACIYLQNFNLFQLEPLFATSSLVIHTWSLSVEEQFYLIYPFISSYIISKFKFPKITLIILILGAFFRTLNYSYPYISRAIGGSFFMHVDYLLIGCYLGYIYEKKKTHLIFFSNIQFSGVYILLFFLIMVFASKFEFNSGLYMMFCGTTILIANVLILILIIQTKSITINNFLENRIVVFIGKLSYSLYVWQQLFLCSSNYWIKFKFISLYPFNLFALIFCSLISYFVIEMPFLKLKTKFSNKNT